MNRGAYRRKLGLTHSDQAAEPGGDPEPSGSLKPLIVLFPGTKFVTSLTKRPGVVLPETLNNHDGIACMLYNPGERKILHENVLVLVESGIAGPM